MRYWPDPFVIRHSIRIPARSLEQRERCRFKGTASARNLPRIHKPAEAVIYSRAKESMRSGSGQRLSIGHGPHAKHKHKVCKFISSFGIRKWNRFGAAVA